MSTTSQVTNTEQHQRISPTENEEDIPQVCADFTKGLTSHDLRAPVSAVHHMSAPKGRMESAVEPLITCQPIDGSQKSTEMFGFLGRMDAKTDVVSNGLIPGSQARKLFNL